MAMPSTNGAIASEIRGAKNLILNVEEQVLTKGQTYDVAIRVKDLEQIQGFQFTLQGKRTSRDHWTGLWVDEC